MSASRDEEILPVLPIKNTVLLPYLLLPLSVGRPGSVAAVETALASERNELIIVTQRDSAVEEPTFQDLHRVGTRGIIKKLRRLAGGGLEVAALGTERVLLLSQTQSKPYTAVRLRPYPPAPGDATEAEALHRAVVDMAMRMISLMHTEIPEQLTEFLTSAHDPLRLAYLLASMISLDVSKEQSLLEAETVADTLRLIHTFLGYELQVLELRGKITSQAQHELNKQQREYVLRQQLETIHKELGEQDPHQAELALLRERISQAHLPEAVSHEVERELQRLERLPRHAPDYDVARSYLEFVVELPWAAVPAADLDIARARRVLEEDHFNLCDVKERILEYIGVLKLNPGAKSPILCFVGPPGVGKTSLGQSIARAVDRKFERMSLGGLHDEAELRGHRRTYIGSMPGRIIQAIRRAGTRNPVVMLDEVDKIGADFRGDPASALLEILDPEQNRNFRDNYLDLPFDLSSVFFITTANSLDTVPPALRDRMEVLRLAGYTEEDKLEIARRYLVPRQIAQTGLAPDQCTFTDATLLRIIAAYTREAGVRQLERAIGRVMRKLALRRAENSPAPVLIEPQILAEFLGPAQFKGEDRRVQPPAGVAAGLAWTEAGGEVLYVEVSLLPAGRGLILTGHLGQIMQESARTARSCIWAQADRLGIPPDLFKSYGLHIHVPEGATPKDGPSAGVAIAAATASAYTRTALRDDTAMTGEVTLTGLVLAVGGIKDKVLAARRAGLQRVILPKANEKDLAEVPEAARKDMKFILVETITEVLNAGLKARPRKNVAA